MGKGFRVPDVDLSAIQAAIVHLSLFQAANGTSLDAITPEVGGAWTEQNGDWDVQSNRANVTGALPDGPRWVATTPTSVSDILMKVVVNPPTGAEPAGVCIRYSDNANLWLVSVQEDIDEIQIYERNAGVWTKRVVTSVTVVGGTDYDITAIADGSTIDGFLDGGSKVTYGSATLNQTETTHGLRSNNATTRFDNFAIFPRTSTTYDSVLNGV